MIRLLPLQLSIMAIGLAGSVDAGTVARLTAALPEIGPPPQGEVRWVSRSMRMNGVPMTLQIVHSRLQPPEVFGHYESTLRAKTHSEMHRSTSGEWQVLGIGSPQHYITIQVRQTGAGSEGTIVVTGFPATATFVTDFPRPPSTRLLSVQEYDDAGLESEHLSLSSRRGVSIEARGFFNELTREGWQVTQRDAGRSTVLEAHRGAEQAFVTLAPDSTQPSMTAIVVVWRKS